MFSHRRVLGSCTSSNTVLSEVDIEWIVRNTDKDKEQVEVACSGFEDSEILWILGTVPEFLEQTS